MIYLTSRLLLVALAFTFALPPSTYAKRDDPDDSDSSGAADDDIVASPDAHQKHNNESNVVNRFLNMVAQYETVNCTPGTEHNLGEGVVIEYGVQKFRAQAKVAVNRANFLTRMWKQESALLTEYFFYTSVRDMVEGDSDIFAAGHCHDHKQFKNYYLFCPYAHRMPNDPNRILVKDLSIDYPYLGNESEFFYQARLKANKKLSLPLNVSKGLAVYPYNDTTRKDEVTEDSILILYEDGHWSKPYYDCGAGNIWMITYTVPFFAFANSSYYFKGTSGIDIDLQKVDINQCPSPKGSTETNVFQDSHKCKRATTQCEPVPGLGFRRGSYRCRCRHGFYFPDLGMPLDRHYYNGSDIEEQYEKFSRHETNYYSAYFSCIPCAPGCDSCIDGSPCILALNWLQRGIILSGAILVMSLIPVLIWFTYQYKNVKVLKAASPLLLRIILLGALFLYCPIIVQYFEPTELTCSLRCWFREIGFSISYGALLLKTWRISVVFRVRSAQRIKISDSNLLKRLLIIVLIFAAYLTARMILGRPKVDKREHSSKLFTYQCPWNVWDICAAVAELFLLLWGIRLCIVVRKAPSEFNESRFISWAIYNETLLSLVINVFMFFLQEEPDLLYLASFIHSQLTTTVTLGFLFGSKAYLVFKYRGKEQPQTTMSRGSKYIAAPKSAPTYLSTVPSSVTAASSPSDRLGEEIDCLSGSTMEKDIQDEFKRLYMQLETLKQKNMKLGNPHLTHKLSAMAEAAMREEPPDSTPTSPNVNGKRVIINLDDMQDSTCL